MFTCELTTDILGEASIPFVTMPSNPTFPSGTATLIGAANIFEHAIQGLSDLGLFVSPAAGQLVGNAIYTLHLSCARADLVLTNAAHYAGQQIAKGSEEAFAETVANASRLRKQADYRLGSKLPIVEIDQIMDSVRANLLVRGIAAFVGDYSLDGVPDAIVVHMALTEDHAFSSHVSLLAGLQWRRDEPLEFERLARALAETS